MSAKAWPKVPDPVRVVMAQWVDANQASEGWSTEEELDLASVRSVSIGYLLRFNDEMVAVAGSMNERSMFGDVTVIPRAWCERVIDLLVGEEIES